MAHFHVLDVYHSALFRSVFGFEGVGCTLRLSVSVFHSHSFPLAASRCTCKEKIVLGSSEETLAKHLPSTITFSGWNLLFQEPEMFLPGGATWAM